MAGGLIFAVGFIVMGAAAGGFIVTPKGENQVVIRTSILLLLTCCYLMWAITYLAQLHPLIHPKRSNMRPMHHESSY